MECFMAGERTGSQFCGEWGTFAAIRWKFSRIRLMEKFCSEFLEPSNAEAFSTHHARYHVFQVGFKQVASVKIKLSVLAIIYNFQTPYSFSTIT